MLYFIYEILIYLIFLLNNSDGINKDILLINEPSHVYQPSYTIISSVDRKKRDQSPWSYPEIDINRISCEQDIYDKLYTCSHFTDCKALSFCLDSLHCPLNIKSYGSLILNLLRLLGIKDCNINNESQTCSNEKRSRILQKLLTLGNKNNVDNYCSTIPNVITEVKKEIQDQCPLNLSQVEAFLDYYSCSTLTNAMLDLASTKKTDEVEDHLNLPNLEEPPSAPSLSQIAYLDEDDDLKFINTNKNLYNNTEQTVYVNDHQYYNVSYVIPKSEGIPINFVEDDNRFIPIHALSNRHRSAFGIDLKFGFPFYGHIINKILIATGGFIYTGDLLHSALIGSTQYIAPFMANFDVSINNNESEITYFDNTTHFICTWNKIYLQDQQDAGSFTFQVILQNTGNIYFNYIHIPQVKISNTNHAHRVGLSDAYMSQHLTNEHIVRVITLYNKINLDKQKIKNGVSIVFNMDYTCNTFTDCSTCLANRGKRYNCSWCDDIQKCSDGSDRSHQQWVRSQCHRLASEDVCPNNMEDTYDNNHFPSSSLSSIIHFEKMKQSDVSLSQPFSTFRTIVITLLISVLILSLLALGVTYIYAYRHPTSPPGMWLLEHRPSNYIARFKRFSG